jgi:uncharacterized membrane protein required for colicin V production
MKNGFPTEIFKLLGTVFGIFLACHYYVKAGSFLNGLISFKSSAAWYNFLNFTVCLTLTFLGYFIFVIIRIIFGIMIRMEAASLLNRWGALVLGMGRWALFTSILLFIINMANIDYIKKSQSDSFLGPKLFALTPKVYTSLWNRVASRFLNDNSFNTKILQIR